MCIPPFCDVKLMNMTQSTLLFAREYDFSCNENCQSGWYLRHKCEPLLILVWQLVTSETFPRLFSLEVGILSFENIQDFHFPWICLMWLTFRAALRAIAALCDLSQLPLMLTFFNSGLWIIPFSKSYSRNMNENAGKVNDWLFLRCVILQDSAL